MVFVTALGLSPSDVISNLPLLLTRYSLYLSDRREVVTQLPQFSWTILIRWITETCSLYLSKTAHSTTTCMEVNIFSIRRSTLARILSRPWLLPILVRIVLLSKIRSFPTIIWSSITHRYARENVKCSSRFFFRQWLPQNSQSTLSQFHHFYFPRCRQTSTVH